MSCWLSTSWSRPGRTASSTTTTAVPTAAAEPGTRARTQTEKNFLALGPVAEAFLVGAAGAGVSKLSTELADIATLHAAHGTEALLAALRRAVEFGRWRAADVRSILSAGGAAPSPRPAGQALVLTLPSVPTRSLEAYTDRWRAASDHSSADPGGGPHRRAETAEDGRDAPPRPRTAPHRPYPAMEPRGVPPHPGRGRDRRPR